MRADIPLEVAVLLEQLDRRIEESKALRVELQKKTAERRAGEQPARDSDTTKTPTSKD